jgi:multisubunit Na+/H+ antiporter MnhG subunit
MRLRSSPRIQGCWLLRAIRGARPDRNPLRRGMDRLEICLLVGLFAVMAVVTPFAAQLVGHASYAGAMQTRQEQLVDRHQVQAVLTKDANPVSGWSLSAYVLTPATWTSVTGVRRSGEVPADPQSHKGTSITVWTDRDGYLDSPPLAVSEAASQADAATVGVIIASVVVYVIGAAAIRQLLNRRRMAAWDADWAATAPTWNRQSW